MSLSNRLKSRQLECVVDLYKVIYQGIEYYFTSNSESVQPSGGGQVWEPIHIKRSAVVIDHSLEPKQVGIEIEPREIFRECFTYKDLLEIEFYMAHLPNIPGNQFYDPELQFKGEKINQAIDKGSGLFKITFVQGELKMLKRNLLKKGIQKLCNNILYDNHCSLNENDYKFTVTVTAISKGEITATGLSAKPDNYFYLGKAIFTKAGRTQKTMILEHTGDTVKLQQEFFKLLIGDTIDVYAGCDKKPETCLDKFNNIYNYAGMRYAGGDNIGSAVL